MLLAMKVSLALFNDRQLAAAPVDTSPAGDVNSSFLDVPPAMQGSLSAFHTKARLLLAAPVDRASADDINQTALGVLRAAYGYVSTLHAKARLVAAALPATTPFADVNNGALGVTPRHMAALLTITTNLRCRSRRGL